MNDPQDKFVNCAETCINNSKNNKSLPNLICYFFLFSVVILSFIFSTFSIFLEPQTSALQLATKSYWKDWWYLPI